MSVTVRVPAPLRDNAGGVTEFKVEAPTVFDALQAVGTHHPRLRPHIMDRNGRPLPNVSVFVNDTDIEQAQGVQTKLHPGDVLRVVPQVRGGS